MAKHLFPRSSLFHALHSAVIEATKTARETGLAALKEDYFAQVHNEAGEPTGVWKAKTMTMTLPTQEKGNVEQQQYDVPLFAMVKHQSVALDTLKLEFDVELHGLSPTDDDAESGSSYMVACTPTGAFSRKTVAKVEVTFKGEDPCEGIMRINDKILKTFPV